MTHQDIERVIRIMSDIKSQMERALEVSRPLRGTLGEGLSEERFSAYIFHLDTAIAMIRRVIEEGEGES